MLAFQGQFCFLSHFKTFKRPLLAASWQSLLVRSRPLAIIHFNIFRSPLLAALRAIQSGPRATLRSRPLQHLQVAPHASRQSRIRVPGKPILSCPDQHLQLSILSSSGADHFVTGTTLLFQLHQHIDRTSLSNITPDTRRYPTSFFPPPFQKREITSRSCGNIEKTSPVYSGCRVSKASCSPLQDISPLMTNERTYHPSNQTLHFIYMENRNMQNNRSKLNGQQGPLCAFFALFLFHSVSFRFSSWNCKFSA